MVLDLPHFADCQGEHQFELNLSGNGNATLLHVMASLLPGHGDSQNLGVRIRQTQQTEFSGFTLVLAEA